MLKMSTGKENAENGAMEVEETSNDESTGLKLPSDTEESRESSENSKEKDSKKKVKGKEIKRDVKSDFKQKDGKGGKMKDEKSETENSEDENNEEDEKIGDGKVPLLDQPLEMSGTRERKKVQRFTEEYKKETKDSTGVEIPEGRGMQLGNINAIEANIQKTKADALKPLHKILFNKLGKVTLLKKNIRKFNGFDFDEESEQYAKKKQTLTKLEDNILMEVCSILGLKNTLKQDELVDIILTFLMKPEGSSKSVNKPSSKRSSRTVSKKNDSESEEETERKSLRQGKKRIANLKEVSSDEDLGDENERDDIADEIKSEEKMEKEENSVDDDEADAKENKTDDDLKDNDEESSVDSEENKSKSKKGSRTAKRNKKESGKKTNSKKPTPQKKENKKTLSKKQAVSDDESEDDEPIIKKTKTPPTDEEIKSYVEEILHDANLEETTMKIVCKKVYANYPGFDLTHKKEFIKTTVKSLISLK